jgi:hypothetical protein
MQPHTLRSSKIARSAQARLAKAFLATGGALTAMLVATTAAAATEQACPPNMAHVGKSCVDKWEASLIEVTPDGAEVPFSPYAAPNGRAVRAVSQPNVIPQAHISMVEAQRACKASGKRLCHAAEWKTACKGPEKTTYPYGNKHVANACVDTDRSSPVRKLHGGVYNSKNMNDPALNQQPNTLEPTGTTSTCTNAYGVYDMVGNLHEWLDDKAFHGGYYLDTKINREGCDYNTTAHAASYYDYSTGFRCCADEGTVPAEPERKGPGSLDGIAMNEEAPLMSPLASEVKESNDPKPELTHAMNGAPTDGDRPTLSASYEDRSAKRDSLYPS